MTTTIATTSNKGLPVIELFGPTIQGEGLMQGTLSHFLRLGGCPLRCVWCDSMYAVDPQQVKDNRKMMKSHEVLTAIGDLSWAPWITLTGGDPCMHKGVEDIIPAINGSGTRVAVETQGTLFPDWLSAVDLVTFSPKPPSSGNVVEWAPIISWLVGKRSKMQQVCIKIVIGDEDDFIWAMNVYNNCPENLIDAFYFTSLTTMYENAYPDSHTTSAMRLLCTIGGYQNLANRIIEEVNKGQEYHAKTHIGCQQHVLLWPHASTGV